MDAAGLEQAPAGLCFQQLVLVCCRILLNSFQQRSSLPQVRLKSAEDKVFLHLAALFSVRPESSKLLVKLLCSPNAFLFFPLCAL